MTNRRPTLREFLTLFAGMAVIAVPWFAGLCWMLGVL